MTRRVIVGCHRLRFAETSGGDRAWGQVLGYEVGSYRFGALLREALIELISAYAICVTFYFQRQARMTEHNPSNFRQLLLRSGLEGVFARVEQNIGHVDDDNPRAVSRVSRISLSCCRSCSRN